MLVLLELSALDRTYGCCVVCCPRLFLSSLRHRVWSRPRIDHPGCAPPVFSLASLLRDRYLVSHTQSSSAYLIYAIALET